MYICFEQKNKKLSLLREVNDVLVRCKRREDRRETIERKFQRNMRHIGKLSNFDYANAFQTMLKMFSCGYFIIREN